MLEVSKNINDNRKVLLITGTAAAGKTSLGQLIESKSDYIFIDGDAIQKRVNYFAKQDPNYKVDFYAEIIDTMLILLALGVILKENAGLVEKNGLMNGMMICVLFC